MHNVYTQAHHNLAHRVHTPRRDLHLVVCVRMTAPICHMSRRDHVRYHDTLYSRDRSRHTNALVEILVYCSRYIVEAQV